MVPNAGKDLLSSLTGNVESAYITVHDFRSAGAPDLPDPAKIRQALTEGTGAFQMENAKNKRFRVQFNPSELQVYATSDPIEKLSAQQREGEGQREAVVDSPVSGRLELSVSLIFDHMNVSTSFMMEKNLLPVSASGITNLVTLGMDKQFTVQTEVEGFIAALRNLYTQQATFEWSDFTFTGALLYVGAQYTMFSTNGTPVRAKVSLRLRQEKNGRHLDKWFEDYEKAFGGDKSNLVRPEQYVGNLLNLGL